MLISRTIFSLAAGLFILGMTQGLGGIIKKKYFTKIIDLLSKEE